MTHSLDLVEAPEAVREYFAALGIGPGDRIYLRKLPRIIIADLAHERIRGGQSVRKLAIQFSRHPKTISRRLKRLGLPTRSPRISLRAQASTSPATGGRDHA